MMNRLMIIFFPVLLSVQVRAEVITSNGEHIFKTICFACHSIGNGKIVGPDLKGVNERHDEAWLLKWVKSAQTVISSGDTSAIRLSKCCSGVTMPDQNLSDEEIKSIFAFIKAEGEKYGSSTIVSSSPTTAEVKNEIKENKSEGNGSSFNYWLFFLVAIFFLGIIGVMAMAIKYLSVELQNEYKKNKNYEKI